MKLIPLWAAVLVAVAIGLPRPSESPRVVVKVAASRTCAEDAQCFSWSTMGNLERGVFVKGKRARVTVEPCEFAYLDFAARIDWKRTRHLRGDEFARRHGCDWRMFAPDAS